MKKIKLTYTVIFVIAVLFSCNNKETFAENKEDLIAMTNEEINSITEEDSVTAGKIYFSKSEFEGMKLFMKHCNQCHPGGEKGKGPSLNDKNLPDFAIHFQIRNGLGDMPAFKKNEISKENVKKIILFARLMRETAND